MGRVHITEPKVTDNLCWKAKVSDLSLGMKSEQAVNGSINREKQIKSWRRKKKNELVGKDNAGWDDISDDLFVS